MVVPVVGAADPLASAFGERPGCAIILDAQSGKLIAAHRLSVCAQTLSRPGSTIKPFAIAAMLDRGTITPDTSFVCRRRVRIAGRELDCSHDRIASALKASEAIAYSCNFWVTHFAANVDLTEALRSYGLASKTGLTANEAVGEIEAAITPAARQLQAIGESNIVVSPLSLALAYRKLATHARPPVLDGLIRSVKEGTGQLASTPLVEVAGKTGTALTLDGSRRQAWFAGFAPARDPKIVFVVFVPQGSGAHDAAPIAKAVVEQWAKRK